MDAHEDERSEESEDHSNCYDCEDGHEQWVQWGAVKLRELSVDWTVPGDKKQDQDGGFRCHIRPTRTIDEACGVAENLASEH
jgi:hypothetical protein